MDENYHQNAVHLWSASLKVDELEYEILSQSLSSDEWQRAAHFVFEQDRRNFVVARGVLRDVLAKYLNRQPKEVRFDYEPYGKPRISQPENTTRVEFNLSHSSGLFVLAVADGKKVGIDIERVRSLPDLEQIASHAFSSYEQKELSTFTGEEKLRSFFRCWTRKEAYLKARGDGLLVPLDTFDMSLAADNPIHMLSNRLDPHEVSRWSFYTFLPEQGFIGALAMEGQGAVPEFKPWTTADF